MSKAIKAMKSILCVRAQVIIARIAISFLVHTLLSRALTICFLFID